MAIAFASGFPVRFRANGFPFGAHPSTRRTSFKYNFRLPTQHVLRSERHHTCVADGPLVDTERQPVEWIFDNPESSYLLQGNSSPSNRPILLYVCGLGAEPLPPSQASRLRSDYEIVSLAHRSGDTSDWKTLVDAALFHIINLRSNAPEPLTMVAESFGAVFALRLVAAAPQGQFKRQVLINPATAILNDSFLNFVCSLLPLLRLDPTHRIAYKLAAAFFFQFILTDERRLAPSNIPGGIRLLRSVDINRVTLSTLLHQVSLLTKTEYCIGDDFLRQQVAIPTTLVASARDKLLQSPSEVERLASILPNVEQQIILPHSAHAALFERDVDLSKILHYSPREASNRRRNWLQGHDQWSNIRYEAAVDQGKRFFEPWYKLTSPKVYGQDKVSDALLKSVISSSKRRAVVFVGNHGVHGILDTSLLLLELSSLLEGRKLRPLAAPTHFSVYKSISSGRWSDFLNDLGAVVATPRNFCKLLASGEMILLFPGGGREVQRRRGEENTVQWNTSSNFVRIAAKYNALIVPFSAVGADEAVDILIDGQEIQRFPFIGPWIQGLLDKNGLSRDSVPPLTSFPPRADRFYFQFHRAVDTTELDAKDKRSCTRIFENTERAVQKGIDDLLMIRKQDPQRRFPIRLLEDRFGMDLAFQPAQKLWSSLGSAVDALLSPLN